MGGGVSGEIGLSPRAANYWVTGVAGNPAGQMWTKEGQVVPTVIGAMGGILEGKTSCD